MDRVAVFRGGRGLHDQRAGEAGGRPLDPNHLHHMEVVTSTVAGITLRDNVTRFSRQLFSLAKLTPLGL